MLKLGPFRSNLDVADTNEGVLADLLNASLKPDGAGVAYGPLSGALVLFDDEFQQGPPSGTLTCVTAAGIYVVFAMSPSAIYRIGTDGSFTQIGSGYNLPSGDRWGAAQFGSKAVFTNLNDGMLQYDIELGGAVSAISGAPKARTLAVIFDSLFAFNCDGDNKLFRYSSINEHTNWTTGTSNYQPVPDGEEILWGAEVTDGTALVFQRNAIRVLYRSDTASMFAMRKPVSNKGAVNPWCIVPVNGGAFFPDTNGFQFATAEGLTPIGRGKANRWWLNDLRTDGLAKVQGAYDAEREVIRFLYPKTTDTNVNFFSAAIDYDIPTNEFVPIVLTAALGLPGEIFTTASPGYTMEELDAFGDMDDLNGDMSLDDRFYFGGVPQLGALVGVANDGSGLPTAPDSETFSLAYFNGDNLAATFETNTLTLGRRTDITEVIPVTDAEGVEVEIGAKDRLSDAIVYEAAATPDEDGVVPVYTAGRYIRLRATIPADEVWSHIRGYEDFEPKPGGRG